MKIDDRAIEAMSAALRGQHERGDPSAALHMICLALDQGLPVPAWAADAFLRAIATWGSGHAPSLDQALGFKASTPKRTRATARAAHESLRARLWMRAARKANPSLVVDGEAFKRMARELGLGAASAKRRYYNVPVWLRTFLE